MATTSSKDLYIFYNDAYTKSNLTTYQSKIVWDIMLPGPKWSQFIIKLQCNKNGLYPRNIVTSERWIMGLSFKTPEAESIWITAYINDLLFKHIYIDKVYFICDEVDITSNLPVSGRLILCNTSAFKTLMES